MARERSIQQMGRSVKGSGTMENGCVGSRTKTKV
jgi:hypothetical protein